MLWTVAIAPPVLVVTSVHADALTQVLPSVIATISMQKSGVVGFVDVHPGFLQLLLTQTWVKCTSLNSSRCVVYSGIRFKAIRAVSEKLEQDE